MATVHCASIGVIIITSFVLSLFSLYNLPHPTVVSVEMKPGGLWFTGSNVYIALPFLNKLQNNATVQMAQMVICSYEPPLCVFDASQMSPQYSMGLASKDFGGYCSTPRQPCKPFRFLVRGGERKVLVVPPSPETRLEIWSGNAEYPMISFVQLSNFSLPPSLSMNVSNVY